LDKKDCLKKRGKNRRGSRNNGHFQHLLPLPASVFVCKQKSLKFGMDFSFINVINKHNLPKDHVITIIEGPVSPDTGFCIGYLLESEPKLVFILHHHGFGHYQGISSKLGHNLRKQQENGNILVIDTMKEVSIPILFLLFFIRSCSITSLAIIYLADMLCYLS